MKKTYTHKHYTRKSTGDRITREIPAENRPSYIDQLPISTTIMAYSIDEANQQIQNVVNEGYAHPGDDEYIVDVQVQDTTNIQITPVTQAISELHTPMRPAIKCHFAFVPKDITH